MQERLSLHSIHFQVWYMLICFWSFYASNDAAPTLRIYITFPNLQSVWNDQASCCTVNKQSVQIRVANMFTIISILTVHGWLEPSVCSIVVVHSSQNSSHHLNTLNRVIASILFASWMRSFVSVNYFSRCTQKFSLLAVSLSVPP